MLKNSDILDFDPSIPKGQPADHVKDLAPEELFSSFMPDDVIELHIVRPTNVKIEQLHSTIGKYNRKNSTNRNTTLKEIKCLIGFLVLTGSRKDCGLSAEEIFNTTYGCQFYKCHFSQKRFEFLIRSLRFDDAATSNRHSHNRFYFFRELWE